MRAHQRNSATSVRADRSLLTSTFLPQAAQRLANADGGVQCVARSVRPTEMQKQGGTQGARFTRHIAVKAAVAPKEVSVSDFHVDSVQIAGFIELAQNVFAIEITLPDGFVDDVRENKSPEGPLIE